MTTQNLLTSFPSCLILREAALGHELDCPQQFGIWDVAGLGLVVAFRGTASQEDVLIDMNIEAVPLDASASPRGVPIT